RTARSSSVNGPPLRKRSPPLLSPRLCTHPTPPRGAPPPHHPPPHPMLTQPAQATNQPPPPQPPQPPHLAAQPHLAAHLATAHRTAPPHLAAGATRQSAMYFHITFKLVEALRRPSLGKATVPNSLLKVKTCPICATQ